MDVISPVLNNSSEYIFSTSDDWDYFEKDIELFKAIEDDKEDDALNHLKKTPNDADKWVVRKATDGSVTWRRLPIHEACIRNPKKTLLDALIKAYPLGVSSLDTCGRLPLHHACVHGASEESITSLILAHPESIETKDMWGKTPFAIAEVSVSENKNKICAMLSMGVPYYYRRLVETEWEGYMQIEKQKHHDKLKSVEEKWSAKVAAITQTTNTKYHELDKKTTTLAEELENKSNEFNIADKTRQDQALAIEKLGKELYDAEIKFTESKYAYDQTINDLHVKSAAEGDEIVSLRKTITEREQANIQLETVNQKHQDTNTNLSNTIEVLSDKSTENALTIVRLELKLKDAQEELKSCKRELSLLSSNFQETRTKDEQTKTSLSKSINDISTKAEEYYALIESLKMEMRSKESQARDLQLTLEEDLKAEKEKAAEKIEQLSAKVLKLAETKSASDAKIKELKLTERRYAELKCHVGTLQTSLNNLNGENNKIFDAVELQKAEMKKSEFARAQAAWHLKKAQSDLDSVLGDMGKWSF